MKASRPLLPLLPLLCALALSVPSSGQTVGGQADLLRQFDGQAAGDEFGHKVAGVGDLDQDGVDDLLVSAWFASPGGVNRAGSVMAYSGATGAELYRWDGTYANGFLGQFLAPAGDVDGDGHPDVAIGETGASPGGVNRAGSAYVYSGRDGTLIHRFDGLSATDSLGSVASAGDVDGDGFVDLLVGASGASPGGLSKAGSAYLHSGQTGLLIRVFHGTEQDGHFGNFLCGAGDIDGDGTDDLLIAGMDEDALGVTNAGVVYLYSGATGVLLREIQGTALNGQLGVGLAALGDLDGDGTGEFAVGAPGYASGSSPGTVDVYSGLGATPILQLQGEAAGDRFGISVAHAGDVDGDGRPELLVGAGRADPGGAVDAGAAYLYASGTGLLLHRFDGVAAGDRFGESVAGAGDLDGDGHAEIAVGAKFSQPAGMSQAGSAHIFAFAPFLTLSRTGISIAAGDTVDLQLAFPPSEAGSLYAVLASISGTGPVLLAGLEIPLSSDPVLDRFLGRNAPASIQGELGTLDGSARATAVLTAGPSMTPALGQRLYFAAVTFDLQPVQGRLSSVARAVTILP